MQREVYMDGNTRSVRMSGTISAETFNFIFYGVLLFIVALILVWFILYASSMARIAITSRSVWWWLSWVPILNILMLPILVDDYIIPALKRKALLIYIVTGASIPLSLTGSSVGSALLPVFGVVNAYFIFTLLNSLEEETAWMYTSIIMGTAGLISPLILFKVRNNERTNFNLR